MTSKRTSNQTSNQTSRGLLAQSCCNVLAVAVALVGISCMPAGSSASGASGPTPSGGFGRRDERQFIGSYATVQAVALSRRFVYAVTPDGIAIYDRLVNAWQPPLTRDNGFTDMQITAIAGDPIEDAVWYGAPGAIVVYRPQVDQVQRSIISGVPDYIAFDRTPLGDAYVRATGTWSRVSRTGLVTPIARPPTAASLIAPRSLNDVFAQYPILRTSQSLLSRNQRADRALRTYPIVSGGVSDDRASEVWLGTAGDGLYKVDPAFQQATPLRFGPIDGGIGALALAADGIWAAGLGDASPSVASGNRQPRAGLSFASNDLQRWRWIDGTIAVPLIGARADAMAVRGNRAWIATDRGLVRVRLDGSEAIAAWTTLDGMPDDRVLSLAATAEGTWAGTARGLVWVSDSADARNPRTRGIGQRLLENTSVFALQAIGDTLWIGTSAGLVALAGGNGAGLNVATSALSRPLGAEPALRRPVRAMAWSDSVLLAATDDGVLQLTPRRATEPIRVPDLDGRPVGQVTRLVMDDRTIFLAGTDGLLVASRRGGARRLLRAPRDLPGPVTDVVASREWLWVGTPFGILRLRRSADGGLP